MLCPECRAALSGAAPGRVRPVPEPPGLPVVHAAARYADAVRAVLLAHKERGALALATPLGTALAGAVRVGLQEACAPVEGVEWAGGPGVPRERGDGAVTGLDGAHGGQPLAADGERWVGSVGAPVLLVPVPSARGAVRARGHDPARRIALAAAGELRRTGTPARVLAVLRQRRAVADQAGLNSRQRLDNLAGALAVAPGGGRLLSEGPVVLVDDLMTTGASLTEAARAVRAARAAEAVAYGDPMSGVRGVYRAVAREGRGEGMTGATEEVTGRECVGPGTTAVDGIRDVICAAVVAAPPDSFEINRN